MILLCLFHVNLYAMLTLQSPFAAAAEWQCPCCRGICNCNECRSLRGWRILPTLDGFVEAHGYLSVAHFLVLGGDLQDDAAKLAAAGSIYCPPERAGKFWPWSCVASGCQL